MKTQTIELVAKFKDQASGGLQNLARESERSSRDRLRRADRTARTQRNMYSTYTRLGIRSEHTIRREIQRTQAAYNRLARSGRASQTDLARAAQTTRAQITTLNRELATSGQRMTAVSKAGSRIGKVARVGGAVALGAAAAGSVVVPAVKRAMSYGETLTNLTNTFAAGKGVKEKWAVQSQLEETIRKALHAGGGSRESAAEALSQLASANVVSSDSAQKILPLIMKAATASGAGAEDVTQIIISALQAGFKEADIPKILDSAMQSGQEGGFELKDMARWLPTQLSNMIAAGMPATLKNLSSLLSLNQITRTASGSSDEAGNNVINFLAKIKAQDTFNRAKNIHMTGIDGTDGILNYLPSLQRRQAQGMTSIEAFVDIARKIMAQDKNSQKLAKILEKAGTDQEKRVILESQKTLAEGSAVGQLVGDRQAIIPLLAMLSHSQLYSDLVQSNHKAEHNIENAHEFAREHGWYKKQQAANAAQQAEFGSMKNLTSKIGDILQKAADAAFSNPHLAAALSGAITGLKTLANVTLYVGGVGLLLKGAGVLKGGSSKIPPVTEGPVGGAAGRSVFARLGGAIAGAAKFGAKTLGTGSLLLASPKLNSGESQALKKMAADRAAGKPVKGFDFSPYTKEFAARETKRAAERRALAQSATATLNRLFGAPGVYTIPDLAGAAANSDPAFAAPELYGMPDLKQLAGQPKEDASDIIHAAAEMIKQAVEQLSRIAQTPIRVSLPEIPVKVSVDNGNITAEVERATARKARRQ